MIVIALRHADRTQADALSPAGERRAELLARMLGETRVSVAFRSQFNRAKDTLVPLKARLPDLRIEEIAVAQAEASEDYAKRIAAAVRALSADAVVAVIGHSDTVGPTIAELRGGQIDPIGENEFDKMFLLFVAPDRPASLLAHDPE